MKPKLTLTLTCNGQVADELDLTTLHDMLNPRPGEAWQATVEGVDGSLDFFDWLNTYTPRPTDAVFPVGDVYSHPQKHG